MNILSLAYAFINTPGVGGVVIMTVFITACSIYFVLTRWIIAGAERSTGGSTDEHEV